MNCPECGDELVYEEFVDGAYIYPLKGEVIDWSNGELSGDCLGHRIRCGNDECGYELPPGLLDQVLEQSLKN